MKAEGGREGHPGRIYCEVEARGRMDCDSITAPGVGSAGRCRIVGRDGDVLLCEFLGMLPFLLMSETPIPTFIRPSQRVQTGPFFRFCRKHRCLQFTVG